MKDRKQIEYILETAGMKPQRLEDRVAVAMMEDGVLEPGPRPVQPEEPRLEDYVKVTSLMELAPGVIFGGDWPEGLDAFELDYTYAAGRRIYHGSPRVLAVREAEATDDSKSLNAYVLAYQDYVREAQTYAVERKSYEEATRAAELVKVRVRAEYDECVRLRDKYRDILLTYDQYLKLAKGQGDVAFAFLRRAYDPDLCEEAFVSRDILKGAPDA